MINRHFKVEGNIVYPSNAKMINWGPFYYHSEESAISKMNDLLTEITTYVRTISNDETIEPYNCAGSIPEQVLFFKIDALNDNNETETCDGIIVYEEIEFEDQEPTE